MRDGLGRAEQLAAAAAEQFHHRGFHRVTLAEVAAGAGITAPAVYRHFRNKQALLAGAINSGLDELDDAVQQTAGHPFGEVLLALAEVALDRNDLWVLLQREQRSLTTEARREVEARLDRFTAEFNHRLAQTRPELPAELIELLGTAALAVLTSPSVYVLALPQQEYARQLALGACAVCRVTLEPDPGHAPPAALVPTTARPRSEELLDAAIELFDERGYAAVSLDDIGAAVGIRGPSIYHHFSSKSELLLAALGRAGSWLAPYPTDPDPTDPANPPPDGDWAPVLRTLVRRYAELAVQQRALLGVYVAEADQLPPEAADPIDAAMTTAIDRWASTLRALHPELDQGAAQVRVNAARCIAYELVRVGQLHRRPSIAAEIETLSLAVLSSPTPP